MVALGAPFWGRVISGANPAGGATIVAYHAVSFIAAIICLLKGKSTTGVIGFLLWPVGLIGAIRLAEPYSIWARRLYDDDKFQRSLDRYPDHTPQHHRIADALARERAGVPR
jgi:hypothetical protein